MGFKRPDLNRLVALDLLLRERSANRTADAFQLGGT
jgi:hypothetical protein